MNSWMMYWGNHRVPRQAPGPPAQQHHGPVIDIVIYNSPMYPQLHKRGRKQWNSFPQGTQTRHRGAWGVSSSSLQILMQ